MQVSHNVTKKRGISRVSTFILASVVLMSLSSCSSVGSTLIQLAHEHIGHPVSQMASDRKLDIGKAELFQLTNGNNLYAVDSCAEREVTPPKDVAHTTWYSSCTIYYEVNPDGIIVNAAAATPRFHNK